MLSRMLVLLIAAGWLAAACVTATLFALLARAGRSDEPDAPFGPVTIPSQRTAPADASLEISR